MGLGDEIMVTALAKKNSREFGKPSYIVGKAGKLRNHDVWNNNPNLVTSLNFNGDEIDLPYIRNHSGARHYIDHAASTQDRWTFKQWDIEPGEIYFSHTELDYINRTERDCELVNAPGILIDNGIKAGPRQNKLWPYWIQLVTHLHDANLDFDVNNPDNTLDIRNWLCGLRRYRLIICHEGGLHHAAAALGIPCITLFGGFISPSITGYGACDPFKFHDLTHAKEFCGMIQPCQHCRDEMMKIKPEEVMEHVKDLLK